MDRTFGNASPPAPRCRTCNEPYNEYGDGYDGECPSCADATYIREETETPSSNHETVVLPFKPRRLND